MLTSAEWRSVAAEKRYLRAARRSPHAAVYVAQAPEGLVGRLSVARDVHPASRHVADLGLMVAATHRRQGIGRALLQRTVEWARGSGISKLELHVVASHAPAIALDESFGFVQEGYRRRHYRRDDQYLDAILMALPTDAQ